ncbi:hypothetical protein [Streptomyces sp. FIT100]|uniref:hypothetical protein n=1 Tax=Streptomyces sp. FIT100 TaxID=2837956 RepID=UPI0021CA579B|nr:hypothetical protein [Streptomyces sp. FIT100]UUN28111.1 hypothetical protein KK483_18250 [Streptomyces sp. FIT100]
MRERGANSSRSSTAAARDGTFATRTKIGTGRQIYPVLAGGSDVTGDGRPDLVAKDAGGTLWIHKGTGSTTAPFAARTRVGSGWHV